MKARVSRSRRRPTAAYRAYLVQGREMNRKVFLPDRAKAPKTSWWVQPTREAFQAALTQQEGRFGLRPAPDRDRDH